VAVARLDDTPSATMLLGERHVRELRVARKLATANCIDHHRGAVGGIFDAQSQFNLRQWSIDDVGSIPAAPQHAIKYRVEDRTIDFKK
jgi:hypothetical protein